MNVLKSQRIDEVSEYYKPAAAVVLVGQVLFWCIVVLSFAVLFGSMVTSIVEDAIKIVFIVLVAVHFVLSQLARFSLVPRAERMRRKQLLSDSFGTPLSHDRTALYYNNEYLPSVTRLAANVMENSLFAKEVAAVMLVNSRLFVGSYFVGWLVSFSLRHDNLSLLLTFTQVLFSSEVLVQWISLEVLRHRHEQTFEKLHDHFLHAIGQESPRAIANLLDAFVEYETTKSSAGLLLSSKVFYRLNPKLTEKWDRIRRELRMDSSEIPSLNTQGDP